MRAIIFKYRDSARDIYILLQSVVRAEIHVETYNAQASDSWVLVASEGSKEERISGQDAIRFKGAWEEHLQKSDVKIA